MHLPANTLLIFVHTPTGFGHIRVTSALKSVLPSQQRAQTLTFGTHDSLMQSLHRAVSTGRLGVALFEWGERGIQEKLLSRFLRYIAHHRSHAIASSIREGVIAQITKPDRIVVVATHFEPAYEIGAVKRLLERELLIPITLVLQVTDASPLKYWYVPEADLTCIPSHSTAEGLLAWAKENGNQRYRVKVLPYPITQGLTQSDQNIREDRKLAVSETRNVKIHVAVPISGAAVGLEFILNFLPRLHTRHHLFYFHIILQTAFYTQDFIQRISRLHYVSVHAHSDTATVIRLYEQVYEKFPITFEITKPSEQTFKCLLTPAQRGGSIMLFTESVGRQEEDNLAFIRRHGLAPSAAETYMLHQASRNKIPESTYWHLYTHAQNWRGVVLPRDPRQAVSFVGFCLANGVFAQMLSYTRDPQQRRYIELRDDGAHLFWEEVAATLRLNHNA
jgi:hypothetical protein